MPPGGRAVNADSGPGRGGTALYVSPGRGQRGVAFAPAVRGYPGGIADMAGDLDEYTADLSFDDDELWEPAVAGEPENAAGPADEAEPADAAGRRDAAEPGDAAERGDAPSHAGPATSGAGAPGRQLLARRR